MSGAPQLWVALVSWNGAQPGGWTHSRSPTSICRPCQLQAPVFTLQSPLFPPSAGAAAGLADLGGRSQAGNGRLGVGTQLDSLRSTMVKLAQREEGLASPPSEPVAGPESSPVPHPGGPPPDSKPCSSRREVTVFTSSSGSGWGGLGEDTEMGGCSCPVEGGNPPRPGDSL